MLGPCCSRQNLLGFTIIWPASLTAASKSLSSHFNGSESQATHFLLANGICSSSCTNANSNTMTFVAILFGSSFVKNYSISSAFVN